VIARKHAAHFKPRRWHAAVFARQMRNEPPRFKALRRRLVSGASGRVLEVGAGIGSNFGYYGAVDVVFATEPDPHMLRRARTAAAEAPAAIRLVQCAAESLPLPDASIDTVVCVLVLCTVQDPMRALAEARRVLRPGGTLRFMEHVRGEGLAGVVHDVIAPAWRHFSAAVAPTVTLRLPSRPPASASSDASDNGWRWARRSSSVRPRQRERWAIIAVPRTVGVSRARGRHETV
jgi:SAM-dependent methyltransferase